MKQVIFLLLSLLSYVIQGVAQEKTDSILEKSNRVILKEVDKKLNIKDKIFIQNKSPYLILQVMVALPKQEHGYEPIGSSTYISSNETKEIASYDNNKLKLLRGKVLAVKVKGAKVVLPENNTSVFTPYGSVGVQHREIDANIINGIKKEDITYDFDVRFFEANHDLYIEIYYVGDKDKSNIMDF